MEIRRYWAVIWKWLWLIIIGTVITGVITYAVSSRIQPTYQATATVVVQDPSNLISGYAFNRSAVEAHAELMKNESVMQQVVTTLSLPYSTRQLRKKISTSTNTSTGSPLIKVSAKDHDASKAQQIADATVTAYIQLNRESVQAAAMAFLSQIQNEIDEASARIDELKSKQDTVGLTPEEEEELEALQDDLYALKTQRTLWTTQLAQAMAATSVSLGEPATLPHQPESPNTSQNVALACIVSLVLTTGGVFLKESLDRRVTSAEHVSLLTGLSTLGTIPKFRIHSREKGALITAAHPRSAVAEAFRMLRTNLDFATLDKPAQTLMLVSPEPKDGKTFVMANLAVILAQTGKTVIAVDADLRRGTMHEIFDVSNDIGLSNLLVARQADVAGYLHASKLPGVKVLAAGPSPYNAADILSSSRVPFLTSVLKKAADIILFDSAPVLAVADAAIFAPKVDGVILVVNARRTRPEALVETANILSKGNARILGVVLNMVKGERGSPYYYRNSDYYSEGEKDGQRKQSSGRRARLAFLKRFRAS